MAVLLLAEVSDGELSMDATAKAVTAAAKMGEVTVLCAGASAAEGDLGSHLGVRCSRRRRISFG